MNFWLLEEKFQKFLKEIPVLYSFSEVVNLTCKFITTM